MHQIGLSLIELVLGLVVVAAAFNVHAGTAKSQRYTAGLQSLQEDGRFGLGALRRSFRLAGFTGAPTFPGAIVSGTDGRTVVVRAALPRDCNGGDVATAAVEPGIAVNTYTLVDASITCDGNASAAQVLVENVDGFRVLYGIDTDAGALDGDGDGVPNRFVAWDTGFDPRRVVALRFALLVNSGPIRVRSRTVAETHSLLGVETTNADRRLREVFATTVGLRNR